MKVRVLYKKIGKLDGIKKQKISFINRSLFEERNKNSSAQYKRTGRNNT